MFRPTLAVEQVVDLLVGLGIGDPGGEIDTDEVRHEQPERAADLAGQPLGDERPRALPRAAELDDVQAVIVRFNEARERPALAKRGHVTGRLDDPEARLGRRRGHRRNAVLCLLATPAISSAAVATPSRARTSARHVGEATPTGLASNRSIAP